MLKDLDRKERLLLLKFVCAFAWADLEVQSRERQFVGRLIEQLKLSEDEAEEVAGWLAEPPAPEDVDPTRVPRQHRALFLEVAKQLIEADGVVDSNEAELYEILEDLLA